MLSFQDPTNVHGEEQYSANKPGPPPLATGIRAHNETVSRMRELISTFLRQNVFKVFFSFLAYTSTAMRELACGAEALVEMSSLEHSSFTSTFASLSCASHLT